MKTVGRIVLGLSILWGWLEAGEKRADNHLQFGPHYALWYSCMFYSKDQKKRKPRRGDRDKIDHLFYPIVSLEHPGLKELVRLQKQFGNLDKVPEEINLPTPNNFVVLVKTRRFKMVDDIPQDFFRKEESIRGLVINEISSLTREEKEFIKDEFPKINFKKVLILEDGRSPVSSETAMGAMIGGGCCCATAALGGVGGLVMIVLGWSSGGKKKKKKK